MYHKETDHYIFIFKCWHVWTVSFLSWQQTYIIRHPKHFIKKKQNKGKEKGCHICTFQDLNAQHSKFKSFRTTLSHPFKIILFSTSNIYIYIYIYILWFSISNLIFVLSIWSYFMVSCNLHWYHMITLWPLYFVSKLNDCKLIFVFWWWNEWTDWHLLQSP